MLTTLSAIQKESLLEVLPLIQESAGEYLTPGEMKAFSLYCEKRAIPTLDGKSVSARVRDRVVSELRTILITDFMASGVSTQKLLGTPPRKSPYLESDVDDLILRTQSEDRQNPYSFLMS